MKIALFCHSILSDWNHGNAHFMRGIAGELMRRGHDLAVFEPEDGWSRTHLLAEQGPAALADVELRFPHLRPWLYDSETLELDAALDGAELVIVHEWTDPALARAIGRRRAAGGRFRLLFHDTHHRALTAPDELDAMGIEDYDGVLAFGAVLAEAYRARGWGRRAWTWHEAADTAVFRPDPAGAPKPEARAGLIWIGNWGDGERSRELRTFLVEPAHALGLPARVHGVRYPRHARELLRHHGIGYEGWIANHRVPDAFAAHRVTVHVPRRPYARALPGIPTIRMFEALACGIPLVSAPWDDAEGLFGHEDYLRARDGAEMTAHLKAVASDDALAAQLAANGLRTIRARHTCAHRVDELMDILNALGRAPEPRPVLAGSLV